MVISFAGLAIVAAIAFLVPLTLGFFPRLRVPSVVVEIAMGVVIGPFGLGWVKIDTPIHVLSIIGMATLLFLGGMEIEYARLRGRILSVSLLGFAVSLALGIVAAYGLQSVGLIQAPLFIAFLLAATAVGLVIPILKDAGEIATEFRPARRRGLVDRGLRDRGPAGALLLGGGHESHVAARAARVLRRRRR